MTSQCLMENSLSFQSVNLCRCPTKRCAFQCSSKVGNTRFRLTTFPVPASTWRQHFSSKGSWAFWPSDSLDLHERGDKLFKQTHQMSYMSERRIESTNGFRNLFPCTVTIPPSLLCPRTTCRMGTGMRLFCLRLRFFTSLEMVWGRV